GWIWHFKQFIRKDVAQKKLLNGIQRGIDTGNHEYTSYVSMDYCLIRLFCGDNLDNVEQNYKKYTNLVLKLKQQYSFSYIKVCHKIVINLIQGYLGNLCLVAGDSEEEENKSIKNWENNAWLLFITYLGKALNYYLVKDYNSAIYSIIFADKYVLPIKAFLLETQHYFFFSLIIFSYYNTCNTEQKKQFLEITVQNQKKMKYWASHCRENFQHKYDLIEAEKARVLGNHWEAENLYEKAIQGAKKYEFIHEEAIAYERGAEFYFSLDRQEIGNLYLRNAHHCYSLWGAKAKVRQLEEEYPQLLINTALRQSKTTINIVSTTGSDTLESLDLSTVIKASQALAGEIQLDKLLEQLMSIAIENAGAQKGLLILKRDNNWVIEAQRSLNSQETTTLQSIPIDSPNPHQPPLLSPAIANYVIHSKETVVLNDAVNEGQYIRDPYIVATQPKSILCTPLINQGKLSGILYLENNLTTNAFTSDRVELLRTLSAQAAISIENARLYHQLEDYNQTLEQQVAERTEQLQQKNEELTQTLQELKTTQDELIQSEKMAALGQLVAGIAHEINTPLGAIRAAIGNTDKALQASLSQIPQLLPQLNPQQQTDFFSFLEQSLQSQPSLSTREKRQIKRTVTQHLQSHDIANAQQLAHLLTEGGLHDSFESQLSLLQTPQAYQIVQTAYDIARLHANSQTINNAVERAAKIVFALKSYARYDHSGEKQSFQITDNIETVLELYQNYLKKGVEVVRHYQPVPEISGYPDELVQVWTNLIHNAIQAMEGKGILEILVRQQEYDIVVEVTDSGCGIPPEIQDKIFQPFFTTKPAGEGSGLGLDIVQKIIEKHQGTITFVSVPSHTTFTVVLPRQ
ncbi:MAG TPA: serine/threonine-protein kinase PknK, partial [Cyanobacteria bacterium UBA12227]|nr:serine/threonine-protein kinase PknK [Cyanobacteria bacterium UBA12227]